MHDFKQASHLFTLRRTLVTQRVKSPRTASITDSVGQHRSHYQLRVMGTLRVSTAVVADSFFESGTPASEALCTIKNLIEKNRSDYRRQRR